MVDPRGASGLASTIFHLYKPEAGPQPYTCHPSRLGMVAWWELNATCRTVLPPLGACRAPAFSRVAELKAAD